MLVVVMVAVWVGELDEMLVGEKGATWAVVRVAVRVALRVAMWFEPYNPKAGK